MDQILDFEIWQGKTVGDVLTLEFLSSVVGSVLAAIAILLVGWALSKWAQKRIESLGHKYPKLDDMLFDFLAKIVRYTILAFTVLFVLNTFGVETTSIIALLGAAGLAIGLALQGTLANVAGGVMLIFFRPIKTGDFVEVNGKMGTVKDINLNYTELADLSNVQVIIPNSEVWGDTITNYSVNDTRRAEWTFGVGYGANLKEAEDVIRETIMADRRAKSEPEPFIQVTNLGGSSVDFLVRVWCDAADYFGFKADMTRAVKEAMDERGVDIPFPTRTVIVSREDGGDDKDEGLIAASSS